MRPARRERPSSTRMRTTAVCGTGSTTVLLVAPAERGDGPLRFRSGNWKQASPLRRPMMLEESTGWEPHRRALAARRNAPSPLPMSVRRVRGRTCCGPSPWSTEAHLQVGSRVPPGPFDGCRPPSSRLRSPPLPSTDTSGGVAGSSRALVHRYSQRGMCGGQPAPRCASVRSWRRSTRRLRRVRPGERAPTLWLRPSR
jgi:hypothetical protein